MEAIKDTWREVLQEWDEERGRYKQEKLVLLLSETLRSEDLRASALSGLDAWRVSFLLSVAEEEGFRMGLASLVVYKRATANDSHTKFLGRSSSQRGRIDATEDDPSEAALCFLPEGEDYVSYYLGDEENGPAPLEELRVDHFVDINGHPITHTPSARFAAYRAYLDRFPSEQEDGTKLEEDDTPDKPTDSRQNSLFIHETDETVPSNLRNTILSSKHNCQRYDGFHSSGDDEVRVLYLVFCHIHRC